ncbi:hypothetical protein [Pedobacter steynii]
MKRYLSIILMIYVSIAQAQRNDTELNRDSVLAWKCLTNVPKQRVYKPIKDNETPGSTYTVWQQHTADMLNQ